MLLLLLSFYTHLHLLPSPAPNFFSLVTNHHIRVEMTGKRVNRCVGSGSEIPGSYLLYRDAKVITWVKNSLEILDNQLHVKLKKRIK